MANIMKGLGAFRKDKCRLLKLGDLYFAGSYYGNGTVTKTFDVKSKYSNWQDLTIDDFCKPISYARASIDGGDGYLQNFSYSYANGILTVSAKQTSNYAYVNSVTIGIYILDRVGGGS